MTTRRILIVGAGIAGLGLARALRLRGQYTEIEVVERATEWTPAGTGMYLPANAVRALRALELDEAVTAHGQPIRRQRFLDHRGRSLFDISLDRVWGRTGPSLAVHRGDLHQVLAENTDVPVRFDTSVKAIDQAAGDRVRVTFTNGSEGEYDVVVGADGIRSTVRNLAFDGPSAGHVGQVCWRTVVEGFPDTADWTVLLGPGKVFLTVPLGRERTYCYADLTSTDVNDPTNGTDWRQLFAAFANPVPSILERAGEAVFSPVEEVSPPAWTTGQVALIGDAAHATSPNIAQGAAMALEDALILARHLTTADTPVAQALETYRTQRTPRVDWVQKQTHRRDGTRNLPPTVRNLVLRTVGQRLIRAHHALLRNEP